MKKKKEKVNYYELSTTLYLNATLWQLQAWLMGPTFNSGNILKHLARHPVSVARVSCANTGQSSVCSVSLS